MIETYYRILKHDPEGNLMGDSGLIPSHSYVIQFLELMQGMFGGVSHSPTSATDVDGTEHYIWYALRVDNTGLLNALAGSDTYGLVVGTNAGLTPEDNENYMLDTKILHSAVGAAGCLNYQAVTLIPPHELTGNIDYDIARTFLNETGSTITVKEIGIITRINYPADPGYHLILRDVVADEAVLDGHTLTVIYTLRTTV